MSGNLVTVTSATGGTGTLTLTGVTGYPGYTGPLGGSGVRWVQYSVCEYTDSSLLQLSKAEEGIGALDLSTLVLTRSKIVATWDGTAYVTTNAGANLGAISFGTTSANIRITAGPTGCQANGSTIPFFSTLGEDLGMPGSNLAVSSGTFSPGTNTIYYTPYLWEGLGEIVQAGVNVTTSAASSGIKAGVYEVGVDGLPGNLLGDLTGGTPFSVTSTGLKTASCSLWLPPGWYYTGALVSGTATYRSSQIVGMLPGPSGTGTNGQPIGRMTNNVTYAGGLPNPAGTPSGNINAPLLVAMKPRN